MVVKVRLSGLKIAHAKGKYYVYVRATGEAFFGGSTWRGRRVMRVSVCNWITSENDLERAIAAVRAALASAD